VEGTIVDANTAGARLLSGTPRGLLRRNLLVFFEQERDAWRQAMMRATLGERVQRSGRVRPKERRPVTVRVEITKADGDSHAALLWLFERDPAA
jgi:PAS domain-containing protein